MLVETMLVETTPVQTILAETLGMVLGKAKIEDRNKAGENVSQGHEDKRVNDKTSWFFGHSIGNQNRVFDPGRNSRFDDRRATNSKDENRVFALYL